MTKTKTEAEVIAAPLLKVIPFPKPAAKARLDPGRDHELRIILRSREAELEQLQQLVAEYRSMLGQDCPDYAAAVKPVEPEKGLISATFARFQAERAGEGEQHAS